MNRPWFRLALVIALCMSFTACETMRDSWDRTQEFYKRYINVDPEVSLKKEESEPGRYKLAQAFTPLDTRIEEITRKLDATDSFPSDEWFDKLFVENSWISGVIVADTSGEILYRRPETAMKPVTVEPFLQDLEGLSDRRVRAMFQESALGPEIYLATPFFSGADLQGVIAVHFDIRNLTGFSPAPGELAVFTPGLMLWPGGFENPDLFLEQPWADILSDDVSGDMEDGEKEYLWVARFIGDKKMLYAVEKPAEE